MNISQPLAISVGLMLSASGLGESYAIAGDLVCKLKSTKNYADTTIACYSDAGCVWAAKLGGEPIRDFDQASAPFALTRGKISVIVSGSEAMIAKSKEVGAVCAEAGD